MATVSPGAAFVTLDGGWVAEIGNDCPVLALSVPHEASRKTADASAHDAMRGFWKVMTQEISA